MKHASLFSGIGGFDLAADWAGFENIFNCEINETCRKVLKYYWPNAIQHEEIQKADFKKYRGAVDILSGGFPCQPFSNSGKQLGQDDERFLYEDMLRAVQEIRPRWVIGENVHGITSPKFAEVFEFICSSLEAEGYEVQPVIIPATAVEGEHERYRVWFIAYSGSIRQSRQGSNYRQVQPNQVGNRKTSRFVNAVQGNSLPFVCREHNGISRRLDEEALHGFGNAIVPQIAYNIFTTIKEFENE